MVDEVPEQVNLSPKLHCASSHYHPTPIHTITGRLYPPPLPRLLDMHPLFLTTRGLLHHDDNGNSNSSSKHVCPTKDTTGPNIVPFVGNLTYHQFSTILAGSCAVLSTLIVGVLIAMHALNYSNSVQQRQIIRIALLVPYVAFFSFLIVWRHDAGMYLVESLDFGCAIALSAFLLFMCDLVLSHPGGFDDLFGHPKVASEKSPASLKVRNLIILLFSLLTCRFQSIWYGVLQFIPTSLIIWIATIISLAVGSYCKASNNIHFAHIWLSAFKVIVATVAILSALRFYKQHKDKLQQHKILLKLFTFKSIIGLNVCQTVRLTQIPP
jgi:hypothetical protein